MSMIIKEENGNVLRDYESSTYNVIERAIAVGKDHIAIVQADNEEALATMKVAVIYGNSSGPNSAQSMYGEYVCGFYSREESAFPLVLSDSSQKISGYFEINIGTIVYYPNRVLSKEERPRRLEKSRYVIYTTESFESIVRDYSEKRKCLIVREFPSEDNPKSFTSKPEQLESGEFIKQIIDVRTIK